MLAPANADSAIDTLETKIALGVENKGRVASD
jgi:hypothetical protein